MLVFLDTEFTDFINCELVSIGLVCEDGLNMLYLEVQDFDQKCCSAFVREAVLSQLERSANVSVRKAQIPTRLRDWFATLPANVTLACDSLHDRDLLADAFDGEWPQNIDGWFDLRPLTDTVVYNQAVAHYHTPSKPWHHAMHDSHANRAGWLAWYRCQHNPADIETG